MKIEYDPALTEEVVSLAVRQGEERGDLRFFHEYHTLADTLYERFSIREREEAFEKLHRKLFHRWGFGEPVSSALEEFPEVGVLLGETFVTRALTPKEEGADLSRDRRSLGIKVRSERFLDAPGLRRFLRHELQHIADILDPAFDYTPQEMPVSRPAEENLIKDRYRTLWAISVDGRFSRRGKETVASKEDRWQEFQALYPTIPSEELAPVFNKLWEGDRPTHRALLAMAGDPRRLLELPRKLFLPGAPCPLCRFPTYRWVGEFEEEVAKRIQKDFPAWGPEEGACERCAEVYALGVMSAGW